MDGGPCILFSNISVPVISILPQASHNNVSLY